MIFNPYIHRPSHQQPTHKETGLCGPPGAGQLSGGLKSLLTCRPSALKMAL